MIANINPKTAAEYGREDATIRRAFMACTKAAKITEAEWDAWSKVTGAELRLSLAFTGSLRKHTERLDRLFGTPSLAHLRSSAHRNHPAVLAAIRAAHKAAGVTSADLALYARPAGIHHGTSRKAATPPARIASVLKRMFGTANYAKARDAFAVKWHAYFAGELAMAT